MESIRAEYIEEFTDSQILDLLVRYIANHFRLTVGKEVKLECDDELNIKCIDKNTNKILNVLNLDDVFESCNTIECEDELFENKYEIIDTLNEILDGQLFEKLEEEIWRHFQIVCSVII